MVRHIKVPPKSALLGVYPILSILFGTDNVIRLILALEDLDLTYKQRLYVSVQDTLAQEYPYESTVWSFNDPLADLKALEAALGLSDCKDGHLSAFADFKNDLFVIEDSFPFIHLGIEEIEPSEVIEFSESYKKRKVALERTTLKDVSSVIIPSVTIGSLILLGTKISK